MDSRGIIRLCIAAMQQISCMGKLDRIMNIVLKQLIDGNAVPLLHPRIHYLPFAFVRIAKEIDNAMLVMAYQLPLSGGGQLFCSAGSGCNVDRLATALMEPVHKRGVKVGTSCVGSAQLSDPHPS